MCTNSRFIWNKYARKNILVKCGKCDACKQEKACARSNRIRNNVTHGTIALFVTLTFTNDYVPYIKRSDIINLDPDAADLPVYRQCEIRMIYDRHSKRFRFKKVRGEHVIYNVPVDRLDDVCFGENYVFLNDYHKLVGMPDDYIGVNCFDEYQKFFKRLRQILIRHYNYEKSFSYFLCTEYGSHTYRPHGHILLFIQRDDEATFRSAILEGWQYAHKTRTAKFIEIARDAASYVSSYVNSNLDVYPLLKVDKFKQKHSASKDFGVVLDCFSLPEILKKIDSGDLVYYREQKFDGVSCTVAVPIPRYVLYRYFPICKGFSWLATHQLCSILLNPERAGDILTDFEYCCSFERDVLEYDFDTHSFEYGARLEHLHIPVIRSCKLVHPLYHFTPVESYAIYVRLENCYQRFYRETGLSRYDYMLYYLRAWSVYASVVEKCLHETFALRNEDYSEFYENAVIVSRRPEIAPTLSNLILQEDPNKRRDIIQKTDNFRSLYSRLNKQKKVTNYSMSHMGYDV